MPDRRHDGQHLVEFDGVRLTRLPAGRAEGFVWLSFFDIAIRDTGASSLVLDYVKGSDDLGGEVVSIPA